MTSFAKRLRKARDARNISRKELARKINRSHLTVKAWELGRHEPSQEIKQAIEIALEMAIGEIDNQYEKNLCLALREFNVAAQSQSKNKLKKSIPIINAMTAYFIEE